ncbi:polysaccharide deacetylase family protein [Chitiniphilus shinanonensis]|uniref:polysaccharide deacetylase family protein n=1 Tax=Chitiniphilus shinanonensis TaxID=553088 RepID=UPI003035B80E
MKAARAVPVLMYHHVSPAPGLVTVSPATFAEHMGWLARAGYTTLSTRQFAGFLAGEAVPDKSVLVTFDDGYLDNWVYAHPVLARHGQRAVLFTVSGWVGDGPARPHAGNDAGDSSPLPATPDHRACKAAIAEGRADEVIVRASEVAAMRAAGTFEFHSHTHSHTRWDKQCADPAEKRARLAEDLAASRADFATRLGGASDQLCWPQGYFDDDYLAVAREAGFRHLYTTVPGANLPGQDREHIHRLVVKDKPASWLASRLWLYRHSTLARLYTALKRR